MNPRGSWWYIEVLWREAISLCKKFTNESFFWRIVFSELDESDHQIRPNHLKQFMAQAAQIYKLLNQTHYPIHVQLKTKHGFLFCVLCALLFVVVLTLPFLLPDYWFTLLLPPHFLPYLFSLCPLSSAGSFSFSACNWSSLWIFCPFPQLCFALPWAFCFPAPLTIVWVCFCIAFYFLSKIFWASLAVLRLGSVRICWQRLWITGNNVVNNAQFLAQIDSFTS